LYFALLYIWLFPKTLKEPPVFKKELTRKKLPLVKRLPEDIPNCPEGMSLPTTLAITLISKP
jgi:hypothetical protein